MSETVETVRGKVQHGINHPSFRPRHADGTYNGHSNRKNAAKKKAQHLRNQKTRADLYREWQGKNTNNCGAFHEGLKALSSGNA